MTQLMQRSLWWNIKFFLRRTWRLTQARFRLNLDVVCEESEYLGYIDYHDYPDDVYGLPIHFSIMECKRCGKRFTI